MLQFTGRESQYCISAVGGFTDGVSRKEGGMAAGLLRQWPLLLLALLATAMITESVNAGVIKLNSALTFRWRCVIPDRLSVQPGWITCALPRRSGYG